MESKFQSAQENCLCTVRGYFTKDGNLEVNTFADIKKVGVERFASICNHLNPIVKSFSTIRKMKNRIAEGTPVEFNDRTWYIAVKVFGNCEFYVRYCPIANGDYSLYIFAYER